MKQVVSTGQFRKDIRRYRHQPLKLQKLYAVVAKLAQGEALPAHHRPHGLSGVYKGYMECHIENDLLLIWLDETTEIIKLIRFGSHSEVF